MVHMTCLAALLLGAGAASLAAEYITGFEPPEIEPLKPLTGQDGWYLPAVASLDLRVEQYQFTPQGVTPNPLGELSLIAGRSQIGGNVVRAQRDVDLSFADQVRFSYNVFARYPSAPPASNPLGSFSLQPWDIVDQTAAGFLQVNSFVDPNEPTRWRATWRAYSADGEVSDSPGLSPGPAFDDLALDTWYTIRTTIDFTSNRITRVEVELTDSCVVAAVTPADWYLPGGQRGGLPRPTAIRFFIGGIPLGGNIQAWDNLEIIAAPLVQCSGDVNCDGLVNDADLGKLLDAFGAAPGDGNYNAPSGLLALPESVGDEDLGILLANFGCGQS